MMMHVTRIAVSACRVAVADPAKYPRVEGAMMAMFSSRSRGILGSLLLGAMLLLLSVATRAQTNAVQNPGFEEVDDGGAPRHWQAINFDTGGQSLVRIGEAAEGDRYATLSAAEDTQRPCWHQRVEWDESDRWMTVGGVYRTRHGEPAENAGPSIRIMFNDAPQVMRRPDIERAWFDPAETWTPVKRTFAVPEGTRYIGVEVFQWLQAGETDWDSVFIRSATEDEIMSGLGMQLDREPVHGQNLPYSPADGSTIETNPPAFLWLPVSGDITYSLQIDTSPDFDSENLIAFEDMEWCFQMLTETLTLGTWHWRYGIAMGDSLTTWSRVRTFTVPQGAREWPYPGIQTMDVRDRRPRLFITAEELPEIRKRAEGGDLKSIADQAVDEVSDHIGEELIPEPEPLPTDPEKRGPAYTLTHWNTRPPMNLMEQAAFAYLLTADPECGAEAKRRLLHFFSWDPRGSTGIFNNDEPAMWVMMRGTRAYDWTYDLFTEAEREKVEQAMRIRAADMYGWLSSRPFENNPYSSHAGRTVHFLGEAGLEFFDEWPEARKYVEYTTKIYWGVYPSPTWGGEDGGWNEGPGYWGYMDFALRFMTAVRKATGMNLADREFFKNTPYYRMYMTPPHGTMKPFGDCTQFTNGVQKELIYWFSSLNQDPVIRWYADMVAAGPGTWGIMSVVHKDETLKPQPPADLPTARLFADVGLVSMHTDLINREEDVHLAFNSNPYGAVSHGHNDQNCYVLEAYGEPLAIATGYYNRYGSPHHAGWTRETKAKCGITIDGGVGQDRGWHARGKITDFVHGDAFGLAVGDATEAYGGRLSRAIRQIVHVRPGVFVIRDDVASGEQRTWEYWLHAMKEMSVDGDTDTVFIEQPKASLTVKFLGETELTFSQTDQYDPPPKWPPDREYGHTWHLTAATASKSPAHEFLTVLMPAKAGERDDIPVVSDLSTATAAGCELRFPNGFRTIVGFARGDADVAALGNVETDARIFAVTFGPGGSPTKHLLHGGNTLRAGDRIVQGADNG